MKCKVQAARRKAECSGMAQNRKKEKERNGKPSEQGKRMGKVFYTIL